MSAAEGMSNGHLAMDGEDVWFIADQDRETAQGTLFLTKTTTSGDTLVPPTNVDGPGSLYYGRSSLTVTDAGPVVSFMREDPGDHPYVGTFDHDGVATSAAQRVPVVVGGADVPTMNLTALTPAPGGHARLMTSLYESASEIALVDLDATGTPTGTAVAAGIPDEQVGSITTATLRDGSTLIGWDHGGYDGCAGGGTPARTMTAIVDPAWNISAPATLGDQPDQQEIGPVVASRSGAAYIAWTSITPDGATSWLAPYAGMDAAVQITAAQQIVLADAAHGAVVWTSTDSTLNVQPFENTGAGLVLGDLHVYPPVASGQELYVSLAGSASLGGTRYLLAWHEQWLDDRAPTRLYATVVDLADPAPPAMPSSTAPRVLTRPCI